MSVLFLFLHNLDVNLLIKPLYKNLLKYFVYCESVSNLFEINQRYKDICVKKQNKKEKLLYSSEPCG